MHNPRRWTMVWGLPKGVGVSEWRGTKWKNWDNCNSMKNKIKLKFKSNLKKKPQLFTSQIKW